MFVGENFIVPICLHTWIKCLASNSCLFVVNYIVRLRLKLCEDIITGCTHTAYYRWLIQHKRNPTRSNIIRYLVGCHSQSCPFVINYRSGSLADDHRFRAPTLYVLLLYWYCQRASSGKNIFFNCTDYNIVVCIGQGAVDFCKYTLMFWSKSS